ncbi:MAG: xanthine dehydrogenase family protein subunit M [Candidatus Eisenbacteria bacterium]|nr:xanthine dehydrogenase family protein subunit M [Candidatus Eisenbacteria bacterium]
MYEPIWHRPTTIGEVLAILDVERDRARVIAGGTDLVPAIRSGADAPPVLVDLGRVEEMRYLRDDGQGTGAEDAVVRTEVGAMVTHAALAGRGSPSPAMTLLSAACGKVGGPQIRARGTVGGNIANASPAADAVTALLALDASVVLTSRTAGMREVPLETFLLGPGTTALAPEELVLGAVFERPESGASAVYLKEGQRNAMAIAVASVALVLDRARGRLRISLGSVAPTQVRAREAEALFESNWHETKDRGGLVAAVAEAAVDATRPIDDVRASAEYRRTLVQVMVRRALTEAWR